jgi:hypothetical protein
LQKKTIKITSEVIQCNYEVCAAGTLCFPNILDVMVLQNVNLSEDKMGDRRCGLMIQTWISIISRLYTLSAVYISTAR